MNAARILAIALLLAASANAKDAVLPRDGEYLSTAYLRVLEKTKSHKQAVDKTGQPQAITVSRVGHDLAFDRIYNWHEGDRAVFHPAVRDLNGVDGVGFFPINASRFRFKDGGTTLTYQYVGNATTYIADRLLIGDYVDGRGRKAWFGRNGKAHFAGRSIRFEIYLDMVFEEDEFTDRDDTTEGHLKNFGFAWKGNTLYVYNANCEVEESPGCVIDKAKPLAVLHRVKAK